MEYAAIERVRDKIVYVFFFNSLPGIVVISNIANIKLIHFKDCLFVYFDFVDCLYRNVYLGQVVVE